MEAILVPISMFLLLAALVLIPVWLRSRERTKVLDVVRSISEQGATPPPQLLAALDAIAKRGGPITPEPSPERDMRVGAYLLSVCAAMNAFGAAIRLVAHTGEPAIVFMGLSAFPGFIGLTMLGFWLAARSKRLG